MREPASARACVRTSCARLRVPAARLPPRVRWCLCVRELTRPFPAPFPAAPSARPLPRPPPALPLRKP
eukprot:1682726-Lingulodinium_polyedra.AAC.2